jgi:PAS domain S-box-containing protein
MKIHNTKSITGKEIDALLNKNSILEHTIKLIEAGYEDSNTWEAYQNPDGEILYLSASFTQLTGHPREEFGAGQKNIADIIHSEDIEKFNAIKGIHIRDNVLHDSLIRIADPENNPILFSVTFFPVYTGDNKISGTRIRFIKEKLDLKDPDNLLYDESLLRLILNHTNQGIILIDSEGNIVGWNKRVADVVGIPREKVFKEKVWKIQYSFATENIKKNTTVEQVQKFWEDEIFKMNPGELISGFGSVVNADGTTEYIEDMIRPIEIHGKTYYTSFQTYYTDYKKVEEELRNKIDELAAVNRELELYAYTNSELKQFAYTASHQLQEPARTISNFSRIIEEDYSGVLDKNAMNYLFIIRHAAQRMTSLINVIYEYSVLGRKSKLVHSDCNDLVHDALQELDHMIKESGAEIMVENLPRLYLYESEFQRLIKNLVENSIKFRRKDITLRVNIAASCVDGKFVFSVRDNGIGIAPVHKEKIFDIFQRLHENEDEYEGKGVGLAFCKKIVSLHNGDIWLEESKEGEGCEFCFSIPVK